MQKLATIKKSGIALAVMLSGALLPNLASAAATLDFFEYDGPEHSYPYPTPGSAPEDQTPGLQIKDKGWLTFAVDSAVGDDATFHGTFATTSPNATTGNSWGYLVEIANPRVVSDWVHLSFDVAGDIAYVTGEFISISDGLQPLVPTPPPFGVFTNPQGEYELLGGYYGTTEKPYLVVMNGDFIDGAHNGIGPSLPEGLTVSAVSSVPVPAAVWLFGSALAGFGVLGRRKHAITA